MERETKRERLRDKERRERTKKNMKRGRANERDINKERGRVSVTGGVVQAER